MLNYAFTLDNFEYWLLILVRVASFVFIAPFFGHSAVPNRLKAGFAAYLTIIVYSVAERPELNYEGVAGYAVTVLSEGITGILLGFAANVCTYIVFFSGNIIDMDIGLSMATEFNPDMGSETTLTGNLYYYAVMLLMTASNLQGYLIRAVSDSFTVIPIGNARFDWDHLLSSMIGYMSDLFVIGFRIFLPFFACIMILNCVLGVMAKVAPQMNMFAVGMQLKILVGFAVLLLTAFLLPNVADLILTEIKKLVVDFAEGMY